MKSSQAKKQMQKEQEKYMYDLYITDAKRLVKTSIKKGSKKK